MSHTGPGSSPRRFRLNKVTMSALMLVGVGVAAIPVLKNSLGTDGQDNTYLTQQVTVGPLRVSVTERGVTDSLKNVTMSSRVEGSTTILTIVPEGTQVFAPLTSPCDGKVLAVDATSTVCTVTVEPGRMVDATWANDLVVWVFENTPMYQSPSSFDLVQWAKNGDPQTVSHTMHEFTKPRVTKDQIVAKGDILVGDLVAELDSATMREQIKTQRIQLTQAEAAREQAKEARNIQKSQNASDIAAARLKLELAILDLKKFGDGEYLQQVSAIEGEITLAQEELARAQEKYEFGKRISKKGYRSQNDLEADRIAVTKAEVTLRGAREKYKVLTVYTKERTLAELQANAREFALELDRVESKGKAALSQCEADLAARQLTAEVEKSKYERLLSQIEACQMFASQPGEVVYANDSSSRGETFTVEEGGTVRERQAIIKLPDLDFMKVDAKIHESRINLVGQGMPVIVRVDAYPDEIFRGEVFAVSSVPSSTNWYNRDLKEYDATVKITETGEKVRKLRPGLNASIEIIARQRNNVLQAPVQSIVTVMDRHVAFVKTPGGPERRDVKIGESNDVSIEILDGLKEGESVIMNPRTHFSDQISELEDQIEAERAEKKGDEPEVNSATPTPVAPIPGQPAAQTPAAAKPQQPGATPAGPGGPGAPGGFDPAAMFTKSDKNGDGKLTEDELSERLKPNFATLDSNSDGSIDQTEFAAAIKNFTRNRPEGGNRPPQSAPNGGN